MDGLVQVTFRTRANHITDDRACYRKLEKEPNLGLI